MDRAARRLLPFPALPLRLRRRHHGPERRPLERFASPSVTPASFFHPGVTFSTPAATYLVDGHTPPRPERSRAVLARRNFGRRGELDRGPPALGLRDLPAGGGRPAATDDGHPAGGARAPQSGQVRGWLPLLG